MHKLEYIVEIIYKMARIRTVFLLGLFIAIADAASKHSVNSYSPRLILVVLAITAWYILGTCTNDIADEQIDLINVKGNSGRPLVNKQTSRRTLWLIATASAVLSLVLSLLISQTAALITFGAIVLSYVYSMPPIQLSYRGIIAPLFLPIGYVLYPYLLVLQANNAVLSHTHFLLITGLYISFIARIILKDFRDVVGDKKFGKRTFIVRYGAVATCRVSALAWLIGTLTIVVRFTQNPILIISLIPFTAAIFYFLRWLARERKLTRQVQLVGLIGRLGNGAALLILTALYAELEPAKAFVYDGLIVGLCAFGLATAYSLYQPLIEKQLKATKH